jgi:hypothetical protein
VFMQHSIRELLLLLLLLAVLVSLPAGQCS